MVSVNDFRTGLTIEIDGDLFSVVEFMHVKPGKGAAFVRAKLRNVRTGYVVERTFNAGEKLNLARIEVRDMQFLYRAEDDFVFMDTESYEQMTLGPAKMGEAVKYLKDNTIVQIQIYQSEAIGVALPNTVELTVTDTAPSFKGDTATGGGKPATLETGAMVNVPFFVENGDVIQVDTRTGAYLKRVGK